MFVCVFLGIMIKVIHVMYEHSTSMIIKPLCFSSVFMCVSWVFSGASYNVVCGV